LQHPSSRIDQRRPQWRRRVRLSARTASVAALSLSLAVGTTAVLDRAGADTSPSTAFSNGTALAQATIVRVAPGVGSLGLATTSGTSLAQVTNKLAQASAQAMDFGLIGSSLTAPACDGSPGALTPSQLPQPLVVDNRQGSASQTKDEAPLGQDAIGGGRKQASADKTPSSHASVTGAAGSLASVVTLSGGRSDAVTKIDPGKARIADATASVDISIGGVVDIHGAQWHATHRTGENPSQTGSFSAASTTVGGVPLPTDQLQPAQDAMNQALASLGMTVTLPVVQHITSPDDLVQVTPLEIKLQDTPVGKAVLGPGLNATRDQREQVLTQLYTMYCQAEGAGLVADIGLDIASGTGFAIIDIGGVSASSKAVEYDNPFGTVAPFTPPAAAPVETAPAPVPAPVFVPPTPPSTRVIPPSSSLTAAGPTTQIVKTGPLEKICETLSPAKRPGCSTGKGAPLVLLAVALTGGFAYLDWRHQRRLMAADAEAAA